jgi:hypothetical protein
MFIYVRNKKNNVKEFIRLCDCLMPDESKTIKSIDNRYFKIKINDKNYKKYIRLFGNIIVQNENEIENIEKGSF